jgi:hypothetical protein
MNPILEIRLIILGGMDIFRVWTKHIMAAKNTTQGENLSSAIPIYLPSASLYVFNEHVVFSHALTGLPRFFLRLYRPNL